MLVLIINVDYDINWMKTQKTKSTKYTRTINNKWKPNTVIYTSKMLLQY